MIMGHLRSNEGLAPKIPGVTNKATTITFLNAKNKIIVGHLRFNKGLTQRIPGATNEATTITLSDAKNKIVGHLQVPNLETDNKIKQEEAEVWSGCMRYHIQKQKGNGEWVYLTRGWMNTPRGVGARVESRVPTTTPWGIGEDIRVGSRLTSISIRMKN